MSVRTINHTGKVGGGLVQEQWRVKSWGQVETIDPQGSRLHTDVQTQGPRSKASKVPH